MNLCLSFFLGIINVNNKKIRLKISMDMYGIRLRLNNKVKKGILDGLLYGMVLVLTPQ